MIQPIALRVVVVLMVTGEEYCGLLMGMGFEPSVVYQMVDPEVEQEMVTV